MVFAWLLLGNLPPFTESLRGFCERHSEWATAGNSFCSDVVLAVLWIKIFVFTSLGGICVVIADRLRKVHGTREVCPSYARDPATACACQCFQSIETL